MKAAQISLTNYFVSEIQYTANPDFDSSVGSPIAISDYEITPRSRPQSDDRREWEVGLRIGLPMLADRNLPCSLLIDIIGSVHVDQTLREEYIDRFININGVALVFGAAREIVRAITS